MSKFSQNEGLSSYNVRFITQDPKGFIWIATQDGLNLFDGRSFVQYNTNIDIHKRLLASDVRAIAIDSSRHLLWILTNTGGLNAIDYITGDVTQSIRSHFTSSDDWNITMLFDHDKLWIGCMTGIKVYDIRSGRWRVLPNMPFGQNSRDELPSVRLVHEDSKGNIWAFVNHYGIVVLDPDKESIIASITKELIAPKQSDLIFTAAANTGDGRVLTGTDDGLRTFSLAGKAVRLVPNDKILAVSAGKKISAMCTSGHYLYLDDENHMYRFKRNLSSYTILQEFSTTYADSWSKDIYTMYADPSEGLWLGCKQGLAYIPQRPSPFLSYNNRNYPNSGLNHIYAVMPDGKGAILIGQERGLTIFDSTHHRFSTIEPNLSFNYIHTGIAGKTVVSSDRGLYLLSNQRLSPIGSSSPELLPVSTAYINSIEPFDAARYVIGSDNDRGIFVWDTQKRSLRVINNESKPVSLRSNIVNRVFVDSKGRTWVLSDMGIDVLDKSLTTAKRLTLHTQSGEPFKLYFDIAEINGYYWISCYGYGIIQIDEGGRLLQWLNTSKGLCNDGVYKLFHSKYAELIATTNNGVSVIDLKNGKINNYYEQDGLHGNAFEEACGVFMNGRIYAGGVNGFSIIDPSKFFTNQQAPKLYFGAIHIESSDSSFSLRNIDIRELEVPSNALQTKISFQGLSYANPARVSYAYQIPELNSRWINTGSQNFVDLIGLAPGKYTLSVKSTNEAGITNRVPISMQIRVLPKWYQTWTFKIIMAVLLFAAINYFYRYRIRQIRIQQGIRKEIANDLHDDLGGTLNAIHIFTHMALGEQKNNSYLEGIAEHVSTATSGLRDMLWVLDDPGDTLNDVIDRVEKLWHPVLGPKQIELIRQLEEEAKRLVLSKKEKRNILLICKEAINNSLKYAGCSVITISATLAHKSLVLSVADNGKGFADDMTPGHGLQNMRFRCQQIGCQIDISSVPGAGTKVTIRRVK